MASMKKPKRPGPASLPAAQASRVRRQIEQLWKEHGQNDEAVGRMLGRSGLSVRRIRMRENEPSKTTAGLVAVALGMTVADLLAGTGKAVSP